MEKKEILVVISKLKKYIRSASGMNTAGGVAPALSDIIRQMCNEAIEKAKADGRKTVMDRDFL
jgi:histone H3/H4